MGPKFLMARRAGQLLFGVQWTPIGANLVVDDTCPSRASFHLRGGLHAAAEKSQATGWSRAPGTHLDSGCSVRHLIPMCNRFRSIKEWSDIPRRFHSGPRLNFEFNPNVAPTELVPILVAGQ